MSHKPELTIVYPTRSENNKVYDEIFRKLDNKSNIIIEYINDNALSLSSLYNEMLNECDTQYLLFIHDDLILEKGFDTILLNNFKNNEEYGILGVAGTCYLKKDGIWWSSNKLAGQVNHKVKQNNGKHKIHLNKYSENFNDDGVNILDVVAIDGLFIGINLDKIKVKFNENYKGFHYYDIPFCVDNYLNNVKIGVITNLNVIHKSIGEVNNEWHINRKKFIEEYKDNLPLSLGSAMYIKPIINNVYKTNNNQKVNIFIPSKNNFDVLNKCINSISSNTKIHTNYVINIIDTGSDEDVLEKYNTFNENINLIKKDYYHFAKIHNEVINEYNFNENDLILFCNDDIELINDCISLMVYEYQNNKNVGTVGSKLFYANNLIQHGGIELIYQNKYKKFMLSHKGIRSIYNVNNDVKKKTLGNTAALLLTSISNFNSVDGFNENLTECFEDVLLNFDLLKLNKQNIFCGKAHAYHYESVTRKKNKDKTKREINDFNKIVLPYIYKNFKYIKKHLTIQ